MPAERGPSGTGHDTECEIDSGAVGFDAPGPASVSSAEPDLMGELTALADAFYRVVEYLRAWTPPITESEAAEIADAALFRAEKVIARGR